MTEAEWLACADPKPMLEFLGTHASDRKLRLFGCACCRRVWQIAKMPRLKQALDLLEAFIEGKAKNSDRGRAHKLGGEILQSQASDGQQCLGAEIWKTAKKTFKRSDYGFYGIGESAAAALGYHSGAEHAAFFAVKEGERKEQTRLVRDIFPFRTITFDSSWRTSTVITLAQTMYDTRDFSAMPILADALMAAGCSNEDILNHCRGSGPHVRGCFCIDAILNKQ